MCICWLYLLGLGLVGVWYWFVLGGLFVVYDSCNGVVVLELGIVFIVAGVFDYLRFVVLLVCFGLTVLVVTWNALFAFVVFCFMLLFGCFLWFIWFMLWYGDDLFVAYCCGFADCVYCCLWMMLMHCWCFVRLFVCWFAWWLFCDFGFGLFRSFLFVFDNSADILYLYNLDLILFLVHTCVLFDCLFYWFLCWLLVALVFVVMIWFVVLLFLGWL